MRTLFLLNPTAGKADCTRTLPQQINAAAARAGLAPEEYTIQVTNHAGHARELANAAAQQARQSGEELRVFTAGGDGTFNEALTGIYGYANAAVGCLPFGSGNDFLRTFGTKEEFLDLDAGVLEDETEETDATASFDPDTSVPTFKSPALLSKTDIEKMLPTLNRIESWIEAIFAYVSSEAINHGISWDGYKVVEGRSKRQFLDTKSVVTAAEKAGYTDIYKTELISLIHKKTPLKTGGVLYNKTTKEKIGKINKFLVYSFWVYNKSGELLKRHGRNKKMEEEHPFDPIDPIELYYHP